VRKNLEGRRNGGVVGWVCGGGWGEGGGGGRWKGRERALLSLNPSGRSLLGTLERWTMLCTSEHGRASNLANSFPGGRGPPGARKKKQAQGGGEKCMHRVDGGAVSRQAPDQLSISHDGVLPMSRGGKRSASETLGKKGPCMFPKRNTLTKGQPRGALEY